MNHLIQDRFNADFERMFGYVPTSFKLDYDKPPRADIPQWQINRSNARSVGRKTFMHTKPCSKCGGLERVVRTNKCKGCANA